MKSRIALIVFIILAFSLSACATSAAAPTQAPAATSAPAFNRASQPSAGSALDGKGGEASQAESPATAATRLVVKNADMTIVVVDPAAGMASIVNMANTMGGYVVSSKSYTTRTSSGIEVPEANIAVRVPAEKLDDALAAIRKLTQDPTHDVRSESTTGQDVTADYVDLQSRLTSLQNTQAQLIKIQDSATKTEDVMTVFNRLTDINQQIEQIKGQIKFYEESAALSSINVTLLSKAGIAPIQIAGWEPVGIIRDAFQSLIDVGKALVVVVIWLVIFFVPLGLVLYFPGRWLWRYIKRHMPRPAARPMTAVDYYPPNPSGPPAPPTQYTGV